eukprot:s551_g2.t1
MLRREKGQKQWLAGTPTYKLKTGDSSRRCSGQIPEMRANRTCHNLPRMLSPSPLVSHLERKPSRRRICILSTQTESSAYPISLEGTPFQWRSCSYLLFLPYARDSASSKSLNFQAPKEGFLL